MAASDEPRPLGLAVGGLLSLAAGVGIGRFVYTPILPLMVEDLEMSQALAGLLASANFVGYLAGALLAATGALRGSRRMWLVTGLAASVLTTGAMAFVSATSAFLALRFLGGLASAFVLVFASALVLDGLADAGRSELSAVHFAGVGTGIMVSAMLVSTLIAWQFDWRALWLASGIVSLVALSMVTRLVPDRGERPIVTASPAGHRSRWLNLLIAAYGLFGFAYIITGTFLVAIVRGSATVRALEPVVWLVVGITAAPSVVFWTWCAGRIGLARAFAIACLAEALGIASSVLWVAAPGVLLAAALLGGTFMGLTALGLIGARRLAPGDPRRTLAAITAAFGLGQIVGPAFAGSVYDATKSFVVPSLTAVAALVIAAALVVMQPEP